MSVLRKHVKSNFTIVPNDVIRDDRLKLADLGMLVKMLSLPKGWEFSDRGLQKIVGQSGASAMRTALKHLEELGYLRREQKRSSGSFSGVEWTVTDTPFCFGDEEEPRTENLCTVDACTTDRTQLSTEGINELKDQGRMEGPATEKRSPRRPRRREDLVTLGEFGHVSMTRRQYETLGEKLGDSLRDEYVSRVDAYCERKSTTYANPYQTVLNWYRDDVRNNRVPVVSKVCEFSCDDGYALLSVEDASHVAETVMDSILDEARGHMGEADFEEYREKVRDEHDRYMREMF